MKFKVGDIVGHLPTLQNNVLDAYKILKIESNHYLLSLGYELPFNNEDSYVLIKHSEDESDRVTKENILRIVPSFNFDY